MGWAVQDEFIDLAKSRHVVVYRNSDTLAVHHLINEFRLNACPHCGVPTGQAPSVDFAQVKSQTLAALEVHHRSVMAYKEKNPRVRLGSAPKAS
jgi:hypothetical protein